MGHRYSSIGLGHCWGGGCGGWWGGGCGGWCGGWWGGVFLNSETMVILLGWCGHGHSNNNNNIIIN